MSIQQNLKQSEEYELKIGDQAPDFRLLDQDNNTHQLSNYINNNKISKNKKKILIYFYPKDDTPGCTTEGCNFRDNKQTLEDMGLIIFGVSKDSVKSHKKFAEKYNFNFPLLSDESTDMIKSYGAWKPKKFMGREFLGVVRKSVLIDEEGKVSKIYEDVNTKTHPDQIKSDL